MDENMRDQFDFILENHLEGDVAKMIPFTFYLNKREKLCNIVYGYWWEEVHIFGMIEVEPDKLRTAFDFGFSVLSNKKTFGFQFIAAIDNEKLMAFQPMDTHDMLRLTLNLSGKTEVKYFHKPDHFQWIVE